MALQGVCRVVVDNPDARGHIEKNEHGFGKSWTFDDYKPGEQLGEFSPRVRREQVWDYAGGNCEILPELQGAAPRGQAVPYDMVSTNWTVVAGSWRDTVVAGKEDKDFLWYYDGRPDQGGEVRSVEDFWPNVSFYFRRYPVPYNQTESSYVVFTFFGLTDQGTGGYIYGYILPLADDVFKYPALLRTAVGSDLNYPDDIIDEFQQSQLRGAGEYEGSRAEIFSVENTAGALFAYYSEASGPWVYKPSGGINLTRGKLGISIQGHAGCVRVSPVQYPTSTTLQPFQNLQTPYWVRDRHYYISLAHTPAETSATVAGISSANPDSPIITFASQNNHARAVVFVVNQLHEPSITDARTTTTYTFDGQEETPPLLSASGRVDDSWRGATCELEMRFPYDTTSPYFTDSASAQQRVQWTGNELVTVDVEWDTGSRTPGDAFSTDTQFTGYICELNYDRDSDELGYMRMRLSCEDIVGARFSGKKKMINHICYAGVRSDVAFEHVFLRCGVKADYQDLTGLVDDEGNIWFMPLGLSVFDYGARLFQFRANEEVVSALDVMAQSLGVVWGVDYDGICFVKPRPRYVAGTSAISFTLDDDTTTADDLLYNVTATRGHDQFRNYLAAIVGQGAEIETWFGRDPNDSHTATESSGFIGDDWWEVLTETDAGNAALIGQERLGELILRKLVVAWETPGKPDLWPDDFVKVQVDGLEVPADTVFRIIEKNWSIDWRDAGADYRTSFLGVVVS